MMLKRKRDPAFTTPEKEVLLALVEKYFSIIGCKKTDAVSAKNKVRVWRKITTEYNTVSPIIRDRAVLKKCWENLKNRVKQEHLNHNQHMLGTDPEGPSEKETTDPISTKVLKLINTSVTGSLHTLVSNGTHNLAVEESDTMQTSQTDYSINCTIKSECIEDNNEIKADPLEWCQYGPDSSLSTEHPVSPDDANDQNASEDETQEPGSPPSYLRILSNTEEKKRGFNWSPEEKEFLRELTSQSANLLEDKSTKTDVNLQKAKEWRKITNKFNEMFGTERSVMEVKLCWRRMRIPIHSPKIKVRNRKIHVQNRTQDKRHSILNSNLRFKKRQLEMMEEEHYYKIEIAKMTLKKIALEISVLENMKNTEE